MPSKAFGGKLKEFRNRLDIPVGVADIDVAQIGGELRQFASYIETRPIPFNQPASRETVTKILKSWPTTDASTPSGYPQADGTRHSGESATGCTAMHSLAAFGDEERLRLQVADRVYRAALHSAQEPPVSSPRPERSGTFRTLIRRIARMPFCRSTSPASRASASPGRRPVALRSPISVT